MIKPIDPQENLGDTVLFRRNEKEIVWYLGFIDGVCGNSYSIEYADERLSGNGTNCLIGHTSLYKIPVKALTGRMNKSELEKYLKKSPNYTTKSGTRDDHIKIILSNLGTIIENYSH